MIAPLFFFQFTYFYPLNIGNTKIREENNTPFISKTTPGELIKMLFLFTYIIIVGSGKLQLWGDTNNTTVLNKNLKFLVVLWHRETFSIVRVVLSKIVSGVAIRSLWKKQPEKVFSPNSAVFIIRDKIFSKQQ